jgi:hypothetical protein
MTTLMFLFVSELIWIGLDCWRQTLHVDGGALETPVTILHTTSAQQLPCLHF